MEYLLTGLIVFIVALLVGGIVSLFRKPGENSERTVSLPIFLALIGIVCGGVFLIPTVIIFATGDSVFLAFAFAVFSLLCTSLVVAYMNCRITYDDESFESKNFWGIKRKFAFREITGIQGKHKDVKLYVGRKVVRIDELADGKYRFLSHAKKQYRKHNHGSPIPEVQGKGDVFKGNVENPGEFLFIYILMSAIVVGVIILFAVSSRPHTEADLEYISLNFERYEFHDEHLYLFDEENPVYYGIPAYAETLTDAKEFLSLCEKGQTFKIGYISYEDTDEPHYSIESVIGENGAIYLTVMDVHEYRWADAGKFYLFSGSFAVVWFAIMFFSIYVGRHPEKFSEKFIGLFFKSGYVRGSKETRRK